MNEWIPLMEYAVRKGVSLSTLRRHIKANKIQYKVEHGRYLIRNDLKDYASHADNRGPSGASAYDTPRGDESALMRELKSDLQKAHEEIAELKTLIALYEENPKLDS